jgi:hypothetical protein
MVLFQFPFGALATNQINIADTAAPVAFDQARIQQGVFHSYSNRKVHIKVLNIVYAKALGELAPAKDLYRIDFSNMQMIGNPTVAQGNGAQGSHCSHGIVFSNESTQYGLAGAPYEFDAWLQGPLLIADILPHDIVPAATCPTFMSEGFAHALVVLDVTLLE